METKQYLLIFTPNLEWLDLGVWEESCNAWEENEPEHETPQRRPLLRRAPLTHLTKVTTN